MNRLLLTTIKRKLIKLLKGEIPKEVLYDDYIEFLDFIIKEDIEKITKDCQMTELEEVEEINTCMHRSEYYLIKENRKHLINIIKYLKEKE